MRSTDEIKKGLECKVNCLECPYDYEDCGWKVDADALAYIKQLEAELDAAVESMRKDPHCCFHCKHKGKWPSCNSDPRPNGRCFEWRGVQKEE